jgi:hypothetical protein
MIKLLSYLSLLIILFFCSEEPVQANVYATNVKLNGSLNNAVLVPGTSVTISYILNEPATAGVTVQVLQGENVIKTFQAPSGAPGSLKGFNSFIWDGKDDQGKRPSDGTYSISITAAASGYEVWTQITDDTNPGNIVWDPYGIAVNQNTNSPYYGRIFVGNAITVDRPGQKNGIYIYNADASPSDEGGFNTTDYQWKGYMSSPWKMEVDKDDRLYVADCIQYGEVLSFDQNVSTYNIVLSSVNWPAPVYTEFADFRGPYLTGYATNRMLWMSDINSNRSSGIIQWPIAADGKVPQDNVGKQIIAAGPGTDLVFAPWDMAVDASGNIFTIQRVPESTDPTWRVLRYSPPTSSAPRTKADWKINGLENWTNTDTTVTNVLNGLYGISLNSDGSLLAVASRGGYSLDNGGLVIIDAETGNIVTNLTGGPGSGTAYIDVCWDRVGNVYGTQEEIWKTFSPPGPNQSTTVAIPTIHLIPAITSPLLSAVSGDVERFHFRLTGQSNVTYLIEGSGDLMNWITVGTNFSTEDVRIVEMIGDGSSPFFYRVRAQELPEAPSGARRSALLRKE